jgi:hypothetical protein
MSGPGRKRRENARCRFTTPGDPASSEAELLQNGLTRLVEWAPTTTVQKARARLEMVEERLPSGNDPARDEEARTLATTGIFQDQSRHGYIGVMYRSIDTGASAPYGQLCLQPKTLRDVLLEVPKPSPQDRRVLSRIIVTQVRSLHVHFQLVHGALRSDSFVFFDAAAAGTPDLQRPYILDWARASATRGMYQHPGFQPGSTDMWAYDVWAVLMILSEIAEWKSLDAEGEGEGEKTKPQDETSILNGTTPITTAQVDDDDDDAPLQAEKEIFQRKKERKDLITDDAWKGAPTAAVFRFGFAAIDRGFDDVARSSHWEIKKFWDKICDMLDNKK